MPMAKGRISPAAKQIDTEIDAEPTSAFERKAEYNSLSGFSLLPTHSGNSRAADDGYGRVYAMRQIMCELDTNLQYKDNSTRGCE